MRDNEQTDDPLARFIGIWRTGEGMTLEQIIAEQREMRGYDEYDHWVADGEDPENCPWRPAPHTEPR